MVFAQLGDRIGIASVNRAEELLRLTMKLVEMGADGQAANGHGEPPSRSPLSAGVGQRRFGNHVRTPRELIRWTQSCPRTGGALRAASNYHRAVRPTRSGPVGCRVNTGGRHVITRN